MVAAVRSSEPAVVLDAMISPAGARWVVSGCDLASSSLAGSHPEMDLGSSVACLTMAIAMQGGFDPDQGVMSLLFLLLLGEDDQGAANEEVDRIRGPFDGQDLCRNRLSDVLMADVGVGRGVDPCYGFLICGGFVDQKAVGLVSRLGDRDPGGVLGRWDGSLEH